MKQLLAILLGLAFAPLLSAGELDLTIPESPAKTDRPAGDNASCKSCGVVTNVRQLAPKREEVPASPDSPYLITLGEASREPGGEVDMSGARINTWEEWPKGVWQVTVRYDNGAYAVFDQDTQPSLQQGDRVEVISGKPVLR